LLLDGESDIVGEPPNEDATIRSNRHQILAARGKLNSRDKFGVCKDASDEGTLGKVVEAYVAVLGRDGGVLA
jgi:hypothetical protein